MVNSFVLIYICVCMCIYKGDGCVCDLCLNILIILQLLLSDGFFQYQWWSGLLLGPSSVLVFPTAVVEVRLDALCTCQLMLKPEGDRAGSRFKLQLPWYHSNLHGQRWSSGSIYEHWDDHYYWSHGKHYTGSNLSQAQWKKPQLFSIDLKVFGKLPSKLVHVFLNKEVPYIFKESFYPLKCISKGLSGCEDLCPHSYFPVSKLSGKGKSPSLSFLISPLKYDILYKPLR